MESAHERLFFHKRSIGIRIGSVSLGTILLMKIFSKLQNLYIGLTANRSYANLWLVTAGNTIPFGDPGSFRHPVTIMNGIEIDQKIAGLVLELWCAGIETSGSCQGDAKLDEKAFNCGANFYGDCYSAFLAIPKFEDAQMVARALELACDRHNLQDEKRRIRLATDSGVSFVHLNFPAKLLILDIWENFVNDLNQLQESKRQN